MGRRGPPPTPTPILKLRGSKRASRGKREVKAASGIPQRPDWLDGEAKVAWDHLVPLLEGMGVLSAVDGHALSRYCRLWSRWREAETFIDGHGVMYPLKDESGNVKYFQQWPQVSIAAKLALQLTRLEQEFGMTPSARARIPASGKNKEAVSGKARFFEAG